MNDDVLKLAGRSSFTAPLGATPFREDIDYSTAARFHRRIQCAALLRVCLVFRGFDDFKVECWRRPRGRERGGQWGPVGASVRQETQKVADWWGSRSSFSVRKIKNMFSV